MLPRFSRRLTQTLSFGESINTEVTTEFSRRPVLTETFITMTISFMVCPVINGLYVASQKKMADVHGATMAAGWRKI